MLAAVGNYFNTVTERFGSGWNRFWFTPTDPLPLCVVRLLVGAVSFWTVASYTPDLERLFASNGILPVEFVQQITAQDEVLTQFRFSYLDYARDTRTLWIMHWTSLAIVALFALGFLSRVTSVLAVAVIISYVHRGQLITSQFEPVLIFLMLYTCLGPSGARLSLDALLRQRRNPGVEVAPSVAANVALRLMQVHTCIMFVMMAHAKMFGNVWWNGEGIWWLNFNNRGKVVDLASLGEKPMGRYLINAWTHVQVFYELSFPVLVWAPLARPLWLGLGALVWLAFALASGFFTLAVVMTVATLTFVSAEQWRALAGRAPLA